jgi:tetratricopeptide (TPR) repeat protein
VTEDRAAEQGIAGWSLALGLAAMLLYLPTLGHGYVLDDVAVLTHNRIVTQGLSGVPELLTTSYWQGLGEGYPLFYRPLSLISFALETTLGGADSRVSHGFNVALYGLTVTLLGSLLTRGGVGRWAAMTATAWFAALPLHVEVVANVKSRDELLAGLAVLGAAWLSLGSTVSTGGLALLALAALLSKESALAWLMVIPFVSWLRGRSVVEVGKPLLGAVAVWAVLRRWAIGSWGGAATSGTAVAYNNPFYEVHDVGTLIGSCAALVWRAAGLLVWPAPLVHHYGEGQISLVTPGDPTALAGLLVCGGLAALAIWAWRSRASLTLLGVIGMTAAWLPVSNLMVTVPGAPFAERYLYGVTLGATLLVAALVQAVPQVRWVGLALVLAWVGLTSARIPAWSDGLSLATAGMHVAPQEPSIVRMYGNQVAQDLAARADKDPSPGRLAVERLREAEDAGSQEGAPSRLRGDAGFALGVVLRELGDPAASQALERATVARAQDHSAWFFLGLTLQEGSQHQGALLAYDEALARTPVGADPGRDVMIRYNRCLALLHLARWAEAEASCEQATQLDPGHAQAFKGRSIAATQLGQRARADEAMARAVVLDPSLAP